MTKIYSDQNQLAFFYEPDTYSIGSNVGTPQWVGLVQDATHDETINNIPIRYQGSTDRNVDTFADGQLDFTGTFTYFPQDWKFLGFAIGSIGETVAVGSHVFTETNGDDTMYAGSTSSLLSFTLEDAKKTSTAGSNFIRTFAGCVVNNFTATFTQGEPVSCEVTYIAQTGSLGSGAVTAVTPTTTRPYMFSDTQLEISAGSAYDNVTDMSFTVNNNIEAGHYLTGSREMKEPVPMNRDYEFSLTLAMDSDNAKTLYNHYLAGTTFNAYIKSVGTPGSCYITMSGCKVDDMEVPSPVEGAQEQTVTIIPQHVSASVHDSTLNYGAN